ncbi:hypothetical protein SAMN04487979_101387 [Flavobacterium sp. ov086]|nr:hypothetical protein SAMN04487979_101387 [Flavobacterium sp. ov086]
MYSSLKWVISNIILIMLYKSSKYSLDAQGVGNDLYVKFIQMAYNIVNDGVKNSVKIFNNDPGQFEYRSAKAVWLNSNIKKLFNNNLVLDNFLTKKINRLKSHGVDYYVLDGKALICFKKMDNKSKISGFYSKRFKDMMNGNAIHYSNNMLQNLSEMGINKALPIYYIGYILDKTGNLVDIRLVHYNDGIVAYEVSLVEIFRPNLFNINTNDTTDEIKVVSKKRKGNQQTGS